MAAAAGSSAGHKPVANPTYTPLPADPAGYSSFESFYPFYLGEHSNAICRRLHLVGTSVSSLMLLRVALGVASPSESLRLNGPAWKYVVGALCQGYFLAWVGHFFFEKNRPATFKHPIYSLQGDLKLLTEVITLKRSP